MQMRLRMHVPGHARSVPLARGVLRCALRSFGVERDCAADIELALTEACTNVVDHAGTEDGYEVEAAIDGGYCIVEVADDGCSADDRRVADLGAADLSDPLAESGRGLHLIKNLVDRVDLVRGPDCGTIVRMTKELVYHTA